MLVRQVYLHYSQCECRTTCIANQKAPATQVSVYGRPLCNLQRVVIILQRVVDINQ